MATRMLLLAIGFSLGLLQPMESCRGFQTDSNRDATKGESETKEIKEQTIYIPYGKLREVFEKEGRGVFIPYEKFQELWNAARDKTVPAPIVGPPVDALIVEAENEATVEKELVRVKSKFSIELLKKGWNTISLRLADAAILSAKIDGQQARVVPAAAGGYQLLVENDNDQAKSIQLELEFAKVFTKSPGQNGVAFEAPQAPVSRWIIRIPESGVKVQVQPLIAAAELPKEEKSDPNAPNDPANAPPKQETVLQAFVGAAPQVRIDWTPKSEGATGMTALIKVQSQQDVRIDEGVVRTHATLVYGISRAEVNKIQIDVPLDQKVVNVFDPNIRKWDVERLENVQRITALLFESAKQTQNATIELERFHEEAIVQEIKIPAIQAVDVGRQQGVVVVAVAPGLRAEPVQRTGLLQMDMAELPPGLAGQTWNYAYRYSTLPFSLTISIEKIMPRISLAQLTEAYLETESLIIETLAVYNIEQAGVFQLEFDLPEGFEVRQVVGKDRPHTEDYSHNYPAVEAAAVDSFAVTGEKKNRLVVNLAKKAFGKIGLLIQLQKGLDDPNLRTPTGSNALVAVSLLKAVSENIRQARGSLVIYAPDSLRVAPESRDGMRDISFAEAFAEIPSNRENRFSELRQVLAMSHSDQSGTTQLSIEHRKPYVTVKQILSVRVDSGLIKYKALFRYDIRYSGVRTLRIDVPSEVANEIRNFPSGYRQSLVSPAPADLDPSYVAWNLTGETERTGVVDLVLTWEKKLAELAVGSQLEIPVPPLIPQGVDIASGQILIAKGEGLDVVPAADPTGLRPIDPEYDVDPNLTVKDAARAFEFQGPWKLALTATRYALEDVKRTSIERSLARVVATRGKQLGVQTFYRIRSARQRLPILLPADVMFDTQPLRINGTPIALERGEGGEVYVPLAGRDSTQSFILELRYTMPGDASNIALPSFPDDPAIQKTYLAVFLPKEQVLLGSRGPWTEEFQWHSMQGEWLPNPTQQDDALVQWVREGVPCTESPSFQKDGTLYLFSALNPQPPPKGSLRLVSYHRNWLNALIFSIVLVLGFALLMRPYREKVLGVALFVAAIVLIGIFLPTFATHMLNLPLLASTAIVGTLWMARFLRNESALFFSDLSTHLKSKAKEIRAKEDQSTPDFKEASQPTASQPTASQPTTPTANPRVSEEDKPSNPSEGSNHGA